MLANWIKQTTTSTGTGNLTLAAVSGFPGFADRFGINRPFCYSIINPANSSPVEVGYGHMSDAMTLVRDIIVETCVGGVVSSTSPSAVNLAAGTYLVECAEEAGLLAATMHAVYGSGGYSKRVCSAPVFNAGALSAVSLGANQITYFPVYIDTARPINLLMADVTTAVAGATFRFGLYALAPDGSIGNLIFDTGDMSGATATAVQVSLTPMRLPPGWYWGAFLASAAISVRATPVFNENPAGWDPGTARYKRAVIQQALTYGALPLVPPFSAPVYVTTGSANGIPLVWMGVA